MKKIIFLLALMLLPSAVLYSADKFVSFEKSPDNKSKVTLISSDNNRTVISVSIAGYTSGDKTLNGKNYTDINIDGYTSLGNTGQASLPVLTKMISIPNYKNVSIKILNSSRKIFSVNEIIPYQEIPLRNSDGKINEVSYDGSYYRSDRNFPGEIVSLKEIAVMRDHRIAVISINPVQYNPGKNEIAVFDELEFELIYDGYSGINNVTNRITERSGMFENIYRQVIFNYSNDNTFNLPPKMLIIVPDSLYNNIQPFYEWKNQKGIKTTITLRSEINSNGNPTATEIKNFLTARYNSADRTEFVLLVGDARGRNKLTWFDANGGKSDHPYQCLDGTDILPEIVVGRISVQSPAELDSAIANLIQYEKQPNVVQTDWYKRALVLHSFDGIDPINGQVARSVFLNEGGFTNVDMAPSGTSQSQITNYINGGVSWIWFIGHGSETSWADPVWNMSNMVNLNYGKRQPSIVSIACSNADLDYSETNDCFGEAWIERSSENVASNIAASTELCAFYTTDTIGREMLYAYFRHGIYDFGSMLNFGKIQAYNYFNGNGTVVQTINQFMVLGDPSQELFSDVPKNVTMIREYSGGQHRFNIKTGAENYKGALVALSQENDLKVSGYTDSLGNYSFSSAMININAPVNIVITGKNLNPYFTNMLLTSLISGEEIPDNYKLNQNYPNPFNPRTVISFNIGQGLNISENVILKVYDILGNEVTTIVNGKLAPGSYSVEWDGTNVSSGVYFYKLTAGNFSEVKKMSLIK
ncbi:MAG: T9SS type A sorting domain-containing protein [Ignavibacteria bacterium]|nr:T9SS type A sorting domain-containing protein [Ignavibacteria bacterium]